jgi:flavin reductase (DIM6/NTAB) family NADH-FMN oxidoreductase RutF
MERSGPAGSADVREELDALTATADHPVAIVTARADDGRLGGCLVGFTSQCCITPVRYAVWLSVQNHTYEVARDARRLAVHLLSPAEFPLAQHFGSLTGHRVDKFADRAWTHGPGGVPVLTEASGWFAGDVEMHPPSGDHALFIVTPDAVGGRIEGKLLSYQDVRDLPPGNPA